MANARDRRCLRVLRRKRRRGSVVIIVLWAVALGAILTAAVQISATRVARLGAQAVARVQARWAARAGVEQMISILEYYSENPDPDDAFAIYREMGAFAYSEPGDLLGANYAIEHWSDGQVWSGPMDEHTKFNVNLSVDNPEPLLNLPYITQDVVDAIRDWIDEDEDQNPQGAEAAWYLAQGYTFLPRNSYMRNLAEMEMISGAYPEYVREEDWNLNNRFDANEDDANLLWPDDDANGQLNAGWSEFITASSVGGGLSPTGLPRLFIAEAEVDEVAKRAGLATDQAEAIKAFGSNPNNRMSLLFTAPLSHINEDGSVAPLDGPQVRDVLPLEFAQYEAVFGELTMDDPAYRVPGKMNINTVPEALLRDVLGFDPVIADEIIYRRSKLPKGFTSLVQLASISQTFNAPALAEIADVLDVTSNVFTITSIGRSENTGIEVQLIVVVDRSTLPLHILEYREQ